METHTIDSAAIYVPRARVDVCVCVCVCVLVCVPFQAALLLFAELGWNADGSCLTCTSQFRIYSRPVASTKAREGQFGNILRRGIGTLAVNRLFDLEQGMQPHT